VSDEDEDEDDGESSEEDEPKKGKGAAPKGKTAGTKRKGPARDPKKGAKRREWFFVPGSADIGNPTTRADKQDQRSKSNTRWRRSRFPGRCCATGRRGGCPSAQCRRATERTDLCRAEGFRAHRFGTMATWLVGITTLYACDDTEGFIVVPCELFWSADGLIAKLCIKVGYQEPCAVI